MRKIRNIKVDGREARLIKIGGGVMYCKARDYEVLEYLESSGSEWIETDIIPTGETEVYCKFSCTVPQPRRWPRVFGTQNESTAENSFLVQVHNNDTITAYISTIGEQLSLKSGVYPVDGHIYEVWARLNWLKVNDGDNDYIVTGKCTMPTLKFPFCLFSGNEDVKQRLGQNARADLNFTGRIYEWRCGERKFVPVRRTSDGEIGMYDTATKLFYSNRGLGSFIAGQPTGHYY